MADRDVLGLALNDQREAEARIEELRRQIAAEEERVATVEAFIATYREYEQRTGGAAESHDGSETVESESNGHEEAPVTPYSAATF